MSCRLSCFPCATSMGRGHNGFAWNIPTCDGGREKNDTHSLMRTVVVDARRHVAMARAPRPVEPRGARRERSYFGDGV
jgi:hypothetical protein